MASVWDTANVGALRSAIAYCKSSLSSTNVGALVQDANAMPWIGASAKGNLVSGASNVQSCVNAIDAALSELEGKATLIENYQKALKELKSLKSELKGAQSAKSTYYHRKNNDKLTDRQRSLAASRYNSAVKKISKLNKQIKETEQRKDKLLSQLP